MLGAYSGDSITTGYMNVAVGTDSLAAVTTGYENVAIGHDSLKVNTANQNTTVDHMLVPLLLQGLATLL